MITVVCVVERGETMLNFVSAQPMATRVIDALMVDGVRYTVA